MFDCVVKTGTHLWFLTNTLVLYTKGFRPEKSGTERINGWEPRIFAPSVSKCSVVLQIFHAFPANSGKEPRHSPEQPSHSVHSPMIGGEGSPQLPLGGMVTLESFFAMRSQIGELKRSTDLLQHSSTVLPTEIDLLKQHGHDASLNVARVFVCVCVCESPCQWGCTTYFAGDHSELVVLSMTTSCNQCREQQKTRGCSTVQGVKSTTCFCTYWPLFTFVSNHHLHSQVIPNTAQLRCWTYSTIPSLNNVSIQTLLGILDNYTSPWLSPHY